jgi:hypothetical protein
MATREQLIEDFADHKYATGEKFERLINSMKVVQEPVADPAASGTSLSFIDSISQDADGKIAATKKTLDLANAHELNPFKGWYKTGDTLPTDGFDGAYLYFKDTSELTGQTTIYRWNGTAYADTGTVVDTSNVQTFGSGQHVNAVKIKNENGEEDAGTEGVLSAEAGAELNQKKPDIANNNNGFSIKDERENEVLRMNSYMEVKSSGEVATKNFNSTDLKDRVARLENNPDVKVEDNSEDYFSIEDTDGNKAVVIDAPMEVRGKIKVFPNGRIKTDSFDSQNIDLKERFKRAIIPAINYTKPTFRWLDIGNSHSLCALGYLYFIAKSQGVDLSNVAFCRVSRGGAAFDDWVAGWHDEDTSGEGDSLTGGMYDLVQVFGGLTVRVTGNKYTAVNGTPIPVENQALGLTSTRFWGGDCSILRSLLQDNEWDLITIHQRYVYNEKYDESDGWVNDLESGTFTRSGGLKEFVRILRTTNPQAAIGYLFALAPFGFNGTTVQYNDNSLNNTKATHQRWCETVKKFMQDSGIDFIIPCDTALENLRVSSVPNVPNEWDESSDPQDLNILQRWGFNYDSAHTTSAGVAPYTMAAVAWEMVFAPRFNVSILKNGLHELPNNDIYSNGNKFLQPSYYNGENEQIVSMSNPGYAWSMPSWIDWATREQSNTRATATVRLTDDNRHTCQMAAILAVTDMFEINNPDNLTI